MSGIPTKLLNISAVISPSVAHMLINKCLDIPLLPIGWILEWSNCLKVNINENVRNMIKQT